MRLRNKILSGVAIVIFAALVVVSVALWLPQNDEIVDAQGIVSSACQSLRDTRSFTVSIDVEQVEDDETTATGNVTLKVKGDDAHWIYTVDGVGTAERMVVDGLGYRREEDGPWEFLDIVPEPSGFPVSIDQMPCASLSRFTYLGDGPQIRGVSTREFSAYSDRLMPVSGSRGPGASDNLYPRSDWRMWVDGDGIIRRYTEEQTLSPSMTLELDGTFESIGEPLDITAPYRSRFLTSAQHDVSSGPEGRGFWLSGDEHACGRGSSTFVSEA